MLCRVNKSRRIVISTTSKRWGTNSSSSQWFWRISRVLIVKKQGCFSSSIPLTPHVRNHLLKIYRQTNVRGGWKLMQLKLSEMKPQNKTIRNKISANLLIIKRRRQQLLWISMSLNLLVRLRSSNSQFSLIRIYRRKWIPKCGNMKTLQKSKIQIKTARKTVRRKQAFRIWIWKNRFLIKV